MQIGAKDEVKGVAADVNTTKEDVENRTAREAAASGETVVRPDARDAKDDVAQEPLSMEDWPRFEKTWISIGPDGDRPDCGDTIAEVVTLPEDRPAMQADLVAVAKKYAAHYADTIKRACGPGGAHAIFEGEKQPADGDGLPDLVFEEGRAALKLYRQNIAAEFYAGRDVAILTVATYAGIHGSHEIADDVVRLVAISNRPKAIEHAVRRLADLAAELDPEFASVRPAAELPFEVRAAAREAEAQP